jgi:hypothetical protein
MHNSEAILPFDNEKSLFNKDNHINRYLKFGEKNLQIKPIRDY